MRKLKQSLLLILVLSMSNIIAQTSSDENVLTLDKWLITSIHKLNMPIVNNNLDVNGNTFNAINLLEFDHIDKKMLWPAEKESFQFNGKKDSWKVKEISKEGSLVLAKKNKIKGINTTYAVSYVEVDRWMKVSLNLKSSYPYEVIVDGKSMGVKKDFGTENVFAKDFTFEQGKHIILIKSLLKEGVDAEATIEGKLEIDESFSISNIENSILNTHRMTIPNVLDGVRVQSIDVSPNGNYYIARFSERYQPEGTQSRWYEIFDLNTNKSIESFKGESIWSMSWIPNSNKVSFVTEALEGSKIVSFDFENGIKKDLLNNKSRLGSYTWAPNAEFFIYSISERPNSESDLVKKVEGMPDRWPWYRTREFLYKYDVASDFSERLTFGNISTNLQDISPDSKKILYTESRYSYSERPYQKEKLFEMDLSSFEVTQIWEHKFSGNLSYSPDGKNLLVLAGPAAFGEIGVNVSNGGLPNDYDQQAFIYNLATKDVKAITKNFDPSIRSAYWNAQDGFIYFRTFDKSYVNVYRYIPDGSVFHRLNLGMDIINSLSFSESTLLAGYTANGIKDRDQGFLLNLESLEYTLVSDPEAEEFETIEFGTHKDWIYTTKEGVKIDGRVYFPPNFDPNKKYPMIVNYYAGTSPTSRSFRGRYPLNLYAAGDYIVYNLIPSGSYGFGQDYSAAHVNNWGATVADEIIEATKQIVKEHDFINGDKIGCIGASYGGFMTMYLLSKTDIFACGISHAGISSLSSYWGEGYWGYLYSSVASANSFPWNNRELYIEQGALFNADKIKDPLLLLHGDQDTNVPLGESIQLFTALKLLGSPVDFIEIKGQDHHILDYKKRVIWQKTIAAYFDRWLKDQPEWWNDMYPKPNF